jgi:hypothetical protein
MGKTLASTTLKPFIPLTFSSVSTTFPIDADPAGWKSEAAILRILPSTFSFVDSADSFGSPWGGSSASTISRPSGVSWKRLITWRRPAREIARSTSRSIADNCLKMTALWVQELISVLSVSIYLQRGLDIGIRHMLRHNPVSWESHIQSWMGAQLSAKRKSPFWCFSFQKVKRFEW